MSTSTSAPSTLSTTPPRDASALLGITLEPATGIAINDAADARFLASVNQVDLDNDLPVALVRSYLDGEVDDAALPEPGWGPIGQKVFTRTYARPLPDGGKESFGQMCRRVSLGSVALAPADTLYEDEAIELFRNLYSLRIAPAGRHLWTTGTGLPFSRNCFVSGFGKRLSDHPKFGAKRLFEGGGVGGNYSADLMTHTPDVTTPIEVTISCRPDHPDFIAIKGAADGMWTGVDEPETPADPGDQKWCEFVADNRHDDAVVDAPMDAQVTHVPDTREGWVEAWSQLADAAAGRGSPQLHFDLSAVRPYGDVLKTFGGKASGPAPLASALVSIARTLNRRVGKSLGGMATMDIDHAIAAAVVAGGTRRSARMAMMHWADPDIFEFLRCKADGTSHWSTNISVEIDKGFKEALARGDSHAADVFHEVVVGMVHNGEPGFIDTELGSIGEPNRLRVTNPCGEVFLDFDPSDGAGESCNLGSVNLAKFGTDIVGAKRAFELMARFLYRATLSPYGDEAAARIEATNRRIGAGLMGLQSWVASHGSALTDLPDRDDLLDHLHDFRRTTRATADDLADQLGLPRSVKVTAIAPTGTISQLSGTTPGMHPVFARHFLRRVRYASSDADLVGLAQQGYRIVDDVYADNTKVVEMPVRDSILDRHSPELIEQSDEVSFVQFARVLQAVQDSFCAGSDGNSISATAQIKQGMDVEVLKEQVRPFIGKLKGITVFPETSMALSPYEAISREEFEREVARLDPDVVLVGDSNDGSCDTGACPVV